MIEPVNSEFKIGNDASFAVKDAVTKVADSVMSEDEDKNFKTILEYTSGVEATVEFLTTEAPSSSPTFDPSSMPSVMPSSLPSMQPSLVP